MRAIDAIPTSLRLLPRWGLWQLDKSDKKVPYRADGRAADTTMRADWGPFDEAVDAYARGSYDGIGFAFFPEDGLVGIDRDECRDPETGVIEAWARSELLPTYAEVSPSGRGYKQIGRGILPSGPSTIPGSNSEFYDGNPKRERYFTVTGLRIDGQPIDVEAIGGPIADAYRRMLAFDLREAFDRRGWLRHRTSKDVKDGAKILVRCPWADAHTHGDDEAALFRQRGRRGGYAFKCLHSHCEKRTVADVYALFGMTDEPGDTRPVIVVKGDLHLTTQATWAVLHDLNEQAGADPVIYRYGDGLARLTRMTADDRPAIDLLTRDKLCNLVAAHIAWKQVTNAGLQAAYPPDKVVGNLLASAVPPELPRLRRIVSAPIFGPDGSLLTTPGYHPAAQTYYAPDFPAPTVSQQPTADEVEASRALLVDDLLVNFPFATDADRAHAVALLLLLFCRDLVDGNVPLHLIDKPEVGTGAGLLATCCVIPALGRRDLPALTDCDDEDEWRKRITAILRHGPEAVLLDNVAKIDSQHLAALFTAGTFQDRILGTTQVVNLPADMPWIATGNNPVLGHDLVRRVCHIRLDAQTPDPTQRADFKHELPEWAHAHRGELVGAALTLIQHWIASGRQMSELRVASFTSWGRTLGGICAAAGVNGFGANMKTFRERRNDRTGAWNQIIADWWDAHENNPVSVSDILEFAADIETRVSLGLDGGNDRSVATAFGLALRQAVDRRFTLQVGAGLLAPRYVQVIRVNGGGGKDRKVYRLLEACANE